MRWTWLLLPSLCVASEALAQQKRDTPPPTLPPVVVSATRQPDDAFEIPAAIDAVEVAAHLRLGASPAELLDGIPGVVARDRHNYAQDTQIAIRGFGARSAFGIRGVRLFADGIPASQPDGQGQVSHFALAAADRSEVLRGPFSALYGNASGGVIQMFTADGEGAPQWRASTVAGSFDAWRVGVNARGEVADMDYHIDASHFRSGGFRPHSRARRSTFNAKLGYALADGGKFTLLGNAMRQPWTQDPLGLTATQFAQNPAQTAAQATQFNTRKQVLQAQVGGIYERDLGERNQLRAMLYAGSRQVGQYLAIPAGAQAAPRHAGGVIDLDNDYGGLDLRWTHQTTLGGGALQLMSGIAIDHLQQQRRGYENFVGDRLGVQGTLRRDETTRVRSLDPYLQAQWEAHPRWRVLAGLRQSRVAVRTRDRYVSAANPDDSGQVTFSALTPAAGVLFRATPALHLYANYGRGFETPTIAELAYRADGGAGLAFDLRPATSRNAEIGGKWRSNKLQAQATVFRSRSRNELAVATSAGGRTTYRNVASAQRDGAELALQWQFAPRLSLAASYTQLHARFTSAFLGCSARCTQPDTPIQADTPLPGVPERNAWIAVRWNPAPAWRATLDFNRQSRVFVNDASTESAPGYALAGAELAYRPNQSRNFSGFVRVDNLADKRYVSSVIVNDGNGRYYEPGPGRNWSLGGEWRLR